MNCTRCSNGTELNLMNGMCGIRPGFCFALSGLMDLWTMFSQGVALGWFVVAPSGRGACGAFARATPSPFGVASGHGDSGFANVLRLGLGPQSRSVSCAFVILAFC